MIKVSECEGNPYDAARHFGVFGVQKLTENESQRTSINYSVFLPNGGAELSASPKERVYYIVSGRMKVSNHSEEHLLEAGDMIYIAPGEERQVAILDNKPCESLVMIVTV